MKTTVKTIAVLMSISVASISGTTASGVIKDVQIKPFERLSGSGRIAVEGTYASTVSRLNASNHMLVAYSK
jgi:hypothetical protein